MDCLKQLNHSVKEPHLKELAKKNLHAYEKIFHEYKKANPHLFRSKKVVAGPKITEPNPERKKEKSTLSSRESSVCERKR